MNLGGTCHLPQRRTALGNIICPINRLNCTRSASNASAAAGPNSSDLTGGFLFHPRRTGGRPNSSLHAWLFTKQYLTLTVRCWNSQALMTLVATFGKIPLFFCCLDRLDSESSSIRPSPDPTLLSRQSPAPINTHTNICKTNP